MGVLQGEVRWLGMLLGQLRFGTDVKDFLRVRLCVQSVQDYIQLGFVQLSRWSIQAVLLAEVVLSQLAF